MQRSRRAPLFEEAYSSLALAVSSLWLYTCQKWEAGWLASTDHTHIRLLLPDKQSQPLRVSQLSTRSCLNFHLEDLSRQLRVWCFQSMEVQSYRHWCYRNKRCLAQGLECVPCSRHMNPMIQSTDRTPSGTRVMSSLLAQSLTLGLQCRSCFLPIRFVSPRCWLTLLLSSSPNYFWASNPLSSTQDQSMPRHSTVSRRSQDRPTFQLKLSGRSRREAWRLYEGLRDACFQAR